MSNPDDSASRDNTDATPVSSTTTEGEDSPASNIGSSHPTGKINNAKNHTVNTTISPTVPNSQGDSEALESVSRDNTDATPVSSTNTEREDLPASNSGTLDPRGKKNSAKNQSFEAATQYVSIPHNETKALGGKSNSGNNSGAAVVSNTTTQVEGSATSNSSNGDSPDVPPASLTASESPPRFAAAGHDGNSGSGSSGIEYLLAPLALAGCMVLAFTGFMVRRNRVQKNKMNAGMTVFEGIEKTSREPK